MSEKMMSFEEWWHHGMGDNYTKWIAENAFKAARLGTIPAEGAIVVDWDLSPINADSAYIVLGVNDDGWDSITDAFESNWLVGPINRPTTAWTPKVGDAVFVNHPQKIRIECYGVIPVCKIKEIVGGSHYELDGIPNIGWNKESIKPFRESAIGLPWDQI